MSGEVVPGRHNVCDSVSTAMAGRHACRLGPVDFSSCTGQRWLPLYQHLVRSLNVGRSINVASHLANCENAASKVTLRFPLKRWFQTRTAASEDAETKSASENAEDDHVDSVYDYPELYEQAFNFREVPEEVDFIKKSFLEHASRPLTSCLELGCGPAAHCRLLAAQGIRALGLDRSAAMCAYAAATAAGEGVEVQLLQGDMEDFQLSEDSRVDLTICLLGSFSHLLTTHTALSCLHSVHRCLQPDGLFLVEMEHPEHLFSGVLMNEEEEDMVDRWEVDLEGGEKVVAHYGSSTDTFNPLKQVLLRSVRIEKVKGEKVVQSCEECVPQKLFTYTEMELLAKATGFEIAGSFGELRSGVDINDEENAYRMVLLMRKRPM